MSCPPREPSFIARNPTVILVPCGRISALQPNPLNPRVAPPSNDHVATLPLSSITSTCSQVWGLIHSNWRTVPVREASLFWSKSPVEWCARTGHATTRTYAMPQKAMRRWVSILIAPIRVHLEPQVSANSGPCARIIAGFSDPKPVSRPSVVQSRHGCFLSAGIGAEPLRKSHEILRLRIGGYPILSGYQINRGSVLGGCYGVDAVFVDLGGGT